MKNALDIGQSLSAKFTAPDKLTASWILIGEEENGVTYHAVVEGALLTQYNDSLSQVITSSVKIYESASSKSFKG